MEIIDKKENYKGNNIVVFNKNNLKNFNFEVNKEEIDYIDVKHKIDGFKEKNNSVLFDLNFFLNFNIFILNEVELYKIIIILYVNNLK